MRPNAHQNVMKPHLLISTLVMIVIVGQPLNIFAGDRRAAPVLQKPLSSPQPFKPKIQTDGHSCGYLALASVYESYGIDPQRARLRARLGTDVPAVPFLKDTTGTVQPDLLRVLKQDGFDAELVKLGNEYSQHRLIVHLNEGHYALTLVKRRENGQLHWIVLTDYKDEKLIVGDSLRNKLYPEPIVEFSKEYIVSTILLTPADPRPDVKPSSDHRKGLWEMVKTWWRS